MLRLAGSVMVIAGCIGFAAGICRERNQRLRLLVQIRAVYETMKYYIAYQKATIPEALMHLSEKEQEPFGEAFEAVYRGTRICPPSGESRWSGRFRVRP